MAHRLGLGAWFKATIALTYALQVATALVPDVEGRQRTIHKLTAWSMAALFLVVSWLIVLSPGVSHTAQIIGYALAGYMAAGYAALAFSPKAREKFLLLQTSYVIAMQLVVLAAAYQ